MKKQRQNQRQADAVLPLPLKMNHLYEVDVCPKGTVIRRMRLKMSLRLLSADDVVLILTLKLLSCLVAANVL